MSAGTIAWSRIMLTACAAFWMLATTNAQEKANQDFFVHDLFGYGRSQAAERDPALPITDSEVKILKGEGYEHLSPRNGMPYINYTWERIGVVRAIGHQKQELWIPDLIEMVTVIEWPRGKILPAEVIFPCVWALAQIGEPSVEPVLKAIESSRNLRERRLLVLAIEGIRGKAGAAQLLKERGIDISRPVDGPSRPSRRGVHEATESHTGNASKVKGKNDKETDLSSKSRSRLIWAALPLLVVLGISLIWRLNKKRNQYY